MDTRRYICHINASLFVDFEDIAREVEYELDDIDSEHREDKYDDIVYSVVRSFFAEDVPDLYMWMNPSFFNEIKNDFKKEYGETILRKDWRSICKKKSERRD